MTGEKDNVRNAFFALLRAGMWGKMPDLPYFPLREKEWHTLYLQARKQTVEGIIFDGILSLPEKYHPPRLLLLQWTAGIELLEHRNRRMNRAVSELNRQFTENGVEAWLLKGQGVAGFYKHPLHRTCGDIDWYFPRSGDYEKALHLLEEKKIPVREQAGFSRSYSWNGFQVEHHKHLADLYNPLASRYLKQIVGEETARPFIWREEKTDILLPSPVLSHLSVNTHILKHMLAFGIGLRQLCDSARVCYQFHGVEESRLLEQIYRKIGIYRWIQSLNYVLVKELGMSGEYLPFPLSIRKKVGWILDEAWQGGNFGFYDPRFVNGKNEPWEKRDHVWRQWSHRARLHFRYAPWETCWFPMMQLYSRIRMKKEKDV